MIFPLWPLNILISSFHYTGSDQLPNHHLFLFSSWSDIPTLKGHKKYFLALKLRDNEREMWSTTVKKEQKPCHSTVLKHTSLGQQKTIFVRIHRLQRMMSKLYLIRSDHRDFPKTEYLRRNIDERGKNQPDTTPCPVTISHQSKHNNVNRQELGYWFKASWI